MKKAPMPNPKRFLTYLGTPGTKLMRGICDATFHSILNLLVSVVALEGEFGPVKENPSVCTQWEVYFRPFGWSHTINHFFLIVQCLDGFCILDIPMKEYSRHNKKIWIWRENKKVNLYMLESSNDLCSAWDISPTKAKEITKEIKEDWDHSAFYKVNEMKHNLWNMLMGNDRKYPFYPVDPRQVHFNSLV